MANKVAAASSCGTHGRDALLRVRGPAGAGPYQSAGFCSWKLRLLCHLSFGICHRAKGAFTMLARLKPVMAWYYLTAGQPTGPVDVAELERLFTFGAIRLGTFVWQQGMEKWTSFADAFQRPAVKCGLCKELVPEQPIIQFGAMTVCPDCKDQFFAKIREGLAPDTRAVYGGFWIRFGAYLIDQVTLFFIRLPFQIIFQIYSFSVLTTRARPPLTQYFPLAGAPQAYWIAYALYVLFIFLIHLGYSVFFVGRFGATPGKMALKLRIVRSDRSKLTYWRAAARFFAEIVTSLTALVGYVMAAFDSEKRALHDYLCDTRVIKRNA